MVHCVAYAIPIAARFLGDNDFAPGPFNLGWFSMPCAAISCLWMAFMGTVFLFPTAPGPAVADMNYTVVSDAPMNITMGLRLLRCPVTRLSLAACSCCRWCGTTSPSTEGYIGLLALSPPSIDR